MLISGRENKKESVIKTNHNRKTIAIFHMKYTYKYVYRHTHANTRKLTHAHRLHTWYANFERFVYENLCATAADYAPRAIGNGHQQDMPPVPHLLPTSPYWPIDFVKSAQLLFFSHSGVLFASLRTFFFLFQRFVLTARLSLNCDSYFQCSPCV